MYPRLKLLQKLLSDDGAIFISIDNNEVTNLRFICNEIFGLNNFVSCIAWQRTYSPRNDSKGIPSETDWMLAYSKRPLWNPKKLNRTANMDARYSNPDGDPRLWKSGDATAPGAITHTGMVYAIQHPITGKMLYPPNNRCWTFGQEQMLAIMREWAEYELRPIDDFEKRYAICGGSREKVPPTINAILLVKPFEEVREDTKKRCEAGGWPILYFTSKGKNKGNGGIACKRYLDEVEDRIVTNFWQYTEVGHTDEASKELKAIFSGNAPFDTPKPTRLLERVVAISSEKNSIIIDSFAGSGTTAHAVLNLNKQDGGNRKFILVEMEDYAETITAERVRRVIDGYADIEGAGGSFSFYELGEPIILEDSNLNENIPVEHIREYVFYMETKCSLTKTEQRTASGQPENPYYLGRNSTRIIIFTMRATV
jgi:adenine-specific DNA-methyltransferase